MTRKTNTTKKATTKKSTTKKAPAKKPAVKKVGTKKAAPAKDEKVEIDAKLQESIDKIGEAAASLAEACNLMAASGPGLQTTPKGVSLCASHLKAVKGLHDKVSNRFNMVREAAPGLSKRAEKAKTRGDKKAQTKAKKLTRLEKLRAQMAALESELSEE
jgi:DNA repair ATPase RecN